MYKKICYIREELHHDTGMWTEEGEGGGEGLPAAGLLPPSPRPGCRREFCALSLMVREGPPQQTRRFRSLGIRAARGRSKARLMLSFSVSGDAQAALDRGRGRVKERELAGTRRLHATAVTSVLGACASEGLLTAQNTAWHGSFHVYIADTSLFLICNKAPASLQLFQHTPNPAQQQVGHSLPLSTFLQTHGCTDLQHEQRGTQGIGEGRNVALT